MPICRPEWGPTLSWTSSTNAASHFRVTSTSPTVVDCRIEDVISYVKLVTKATTGWPTVTSASTTWNDDPWGVSRIHQANLWTQAATLSSFTIPIPPSPKVLRRRKALARLRARADRKAEDLLRRYLTEEQRETLDRKGHFYVLAKNGQLFQINRGRSRNVRHIDPATGKPGKTYCVHPTLDVPDADTMLAQKLLLECDIERFFSLANVS